MDPDRGLGGMGGAQPLAATMAGASMLAIECQPSAHRDAPAHALPRRAGERPRRGAGDDRARRQARKPVSVGAARQRGRDPARARAARRAPDAVTDQTSAHDPSTAICPPAGRSPSGRSGASAIRRRVERAAKRVDGRARAGDAGLQRSGVPTFDYGNNIRQVAHDEGVADAFAFPGFVPAYIRPLFCGGNGPFRWVALSGDPEDIYRTDAKVKELIPRRRAPAPLARHGAGAHRLPGPAGAHLLGRARRAPSPRARVQRDGREGRAEGADRDRPRSPRLRLGREPEPRDRSDAGRLGRGVRLAAAQRAAQHRVAAPRGCRSITAAASAWATRSTPAW